MAVTFTVVGLQAELSAAAVASAAGDYAGARNYVVNAYAVLSGLPQEAQNDGQLAKYRADLQAMSEAITAAQDAASGAQVAGSDRRRMVRTRLSPGGWGGSAGNGAYRG